MLENPSRTIYILGAGTIGLALAAHLVNNDRDIILGRTSNPDVEKSSVLVKINDLGRSNYNLQVQVDVASLAKLDELDGIIVITAKAYANQLIADQLKAKNASAPIIIMQNGIGVERPYQQAGFTEIYRCVLYSGGQKANSYEARFTSLKSSPIGVIEGHQDKLQACLTQINTPGFAFHVEPNIQSEIWGKAIINAVFNTICPLLEIDNGIFHRDHRVMEIAEAIIAECVQVAQALEIKLDPQNLLEQILKISQISDGQLVSTLQDIRKQSQTEIASLNLEIANIASTLSPEIDVKNTKLLGELVQIKSSMSKTSII